MKSTMTADITDIVQQIQRDAAVILEIVQAAAPQIAGEAALAERAVILLGGLVSKALAAYGAVAAVAITPESIAALLPNPAPLTPPGTITQVR